MGTLRKIVSILFAILFVFTSIFALIFFNFDRRAFTAETYKRVFENEGFYDRLPAVLAETVNTPNFDESGLPVVIQGMSTQAWEAFFRALLPQETLTSMGDEALNSVFDYLNMKSNSAQMSLLPLKTGMTSDAGVQAVYTILETQPECTIAQIAQMTISLLTVQDIQYCNPSQKLHPLLTPVIQAQMQMTALALPDEITLASAEGIQPGNDPRVRLENARRLMRLTPLLPLGMLLMLTLFAVNSLKSWLDWWGIPFLITGLTATLVSLSGAPIIGGALKRMIAQRASIYLPDAFSNYASDLAAAMVKAMSRPILWQGTILALIGLVMVIISFLIRRKEKSTPPSEQETIVE